MWYWDSLALTDYQLRLLPKFRSVRNQGAADHVMAGIDDETASYLRRRAATFARRERRAA
jgi:hypothetical protein